MMTNKTILCDTNIIIRYLMGDHKEHSVDATNLLQEVQSGHKHMIILETILTESLFILSSIYKVPKHEICDSLSGLMLYKGIANHDRKELLEGLAIYRTINIHIVDAILLAKALHHDYEIYSFDKKLITTYQRLNKD